jgi:sec-independent protein translocase protein TatB
MFDIGFSELLVIALVALVVLGPERLPKAARMAGMWMRRARMQWQAVKSELENELADEDMRRSILRARVELREAQDTLRADGARLRAQLADVEARMTEPPAAVGPDRGSTDRGGAPDVPAAVHRVDASRAGAPDEPMIQPVGSEADAPSRSTQPHPQGPAPIAGASHRHADDARR